MAWYAAATSALSYQVALEPQSRTGSDLIGALTTYNTPEPLTVNPLDPSSPLNPLPQAPKPPKAPKPKL